MNEQEIRKFCDDVSYAFVAGLIFEPEFENLTCKAMRVLCARLKNSLKWLDQHPNWISVEDELPKEENAYLVSDGDGVLYGYFIEGRWAPTELNETCTHWMPLPKAPRKED